MHLAIPFTVLMSSYVAAAPSIQHAQISVEITDMDTHNLVDGLHSPSRSSGEPVMIQDGSGAKFLPFNFTLSASHADWPASLPFGFKDLNGHDGFTRGELGIRTEFAFRNGKLINGNQALGSHVAKLFPPWTSLWTYKGDGNGPFLELVCTFEDRKAVLELERKDQILGAYEIKTGEPVFVGPTQDFQSSRLILEVVPIQRPYEINADSAEELL